MALSRKQSSRVRALGGLPRPLSGRRPATAPAAAGAERQHRGSSCTHPCPRVDDLPVRPLSVGERLRQADAAEPSHPRLRPRGHLVQRAQDQSGHASAVQSGRANPTAERLLGTPSISRRPERGACRVALPAAWICALRWRSARAHQEWARSPAPRGVHRPRRQPRLHRDRAIENSGSTCSTQAATQDPWRVHIGYTCQP